MNTTMPVESMSFQGISEQLKIAIAALAESSRNLKQAVIRRDTDQVWIILSEQQSQMENFDHYNHLWKQLVLDSGLDSPQIRAMKSELQAEISKLHRVNVTNGSLVRSFLAAIDRAFRKVAAEIGGPSKVYGKKGRMAYRQTSLLVDRIG